MNQIRTYRKERALTQTRIAEWIGVKSNAVSQWETGKRSPNIRHLQMLAEIFNCSIEDLLKPSKSGWKSKKEKRVISKKLV